MRMADREFRNRIPDQRSTLTIPDSPTPGELKVIEVLRCSWVLTLIVRTMNIQAQLPQLFVHLLNPRLDSLENIRTIELAGVGPRRCRFGFIIGMPDLVTRLWYVIQM